MKKLKIVRCVELSPFSPEQNNILRFLSPHDYTYCMDTNLKTYIENARAKNISDDQIQAALLTAGWKQEQVMAALSQKTANPLLAPPPPVPHIGMWTGFLYILFFISLYVLATSISGILHQWVDTVIPDTKGSINEYARGLTTYIIQGFVAAIIVSYPIFLILALILKRQIAKTPAVKNIRSRKLLIYMTLIGTFLIMISHIIAIIYSFLGGTLTNNALAHLGITFLIAGSIFWYFIEEVKHDRKNN